MKRYLSLFLSVAMIISVLLTSVSCDELLSDLLVDPDAALDIEADTDVEEENSKNEERTTKKKKNEKTTEEYETVTEEYTKYYPEYTYPSYSTEWPTEWPSEWITEMPTYPIEWPSEWVTEWPTEWPSEWITGHVCYDYPVADHFCDMCYARIDDCYDYDCDSYCDACGMSIGFTDIPVDHKCVDRDPRDHMCDMCYIWINDCRDKDMNHCCDICGTWISECGLDKNYDHICDECGAIFSECYDYDDDKYCDYCGVFNIKSISQCGLMSADTYLENGHIMQDGSANSWLLDNRYNCIFGVDNIGFRGWVLLGEPFSDNNTPINAFGYQLGNGEIIWNGEILFSDDVNNSLGTKEAKRYMITVDLAAVYAGEYNLHLYVQDCYGEIYLMDAWGDIRVVIEETFAPEDPNVHSCIDKSPQDHHCDIDGCGIRISECVDKKSNHTCYICGAWMSECADYDYDGSCDTCGMILSAPEEPEEVRYITIAEAFAIGSSFENKNEYTSEKYIITGVISEITNEKYGNFYITDGIDTILVYGSYNETGDIRFDQMEITPQVGDTVTIMGVIGKYLDPQMKNGWIIEHIPA